MTDARDDGRSTRLDEGHTVDILSALANRSRLDAFRLLVRYLPFGLAAGDIARLLAVPHNTLSTHLAILEKTDLVTSRREGRSIIYAANLATAQRVTSFMLQDCCGIAEVPRTLRGPIAKPFPVKREPTADVAPLNVLVVCAANSARSIMAEALLNRESAGSIRAFSAGTHPASRPAAQTLALLQDLGYDTDAFRSKSWEEFSGPDAPRLDLVLTVCDTAAAAKQPAWPGKPATAHWGLPDPASVRGADAEKRGAFLDTYRGLAERVASLVNRDLKRLGKPALAALLSEIHRSHPLGHSAD